MLLIGAGLMLAPLAVLYGDVERLMRIVLRLLFYFSPIIYGLHDVTSGSATSGVAGQAVYILNPFAGIFDLYRRAFFPDEWSGWAAGRRRGGHLGRLFWSRASWSSGGSRAPSSRRSEWRRSSRPSALGIHFKRNRRRHKRLRDMFSRPTRPPVAQGPGKPGKKKGSKAAKFWALRDVSFRCSRARPSGWSAATGRARARCSS